jgi:hypothetical protein
VVHGVQSFLPILRAQNTPAHIVSTSSIAGLWSGVPFIGPYAVSKVGVVSLCETLRDELRAAGSPIGVSVLIPSSVSTKVMESERNRPGRLGSEQRTPIAEQVRLMIRDGLFGPDGKSPDEIAAITLDAIRKDRFWIITHASARPALEARFARDPGGRARRMTGGLDRLLDATGRDDDAVAVSKLRSMRRLVLATLALEGWVALRYVPYSESPGFHAAIAAAHGVCLLLGWRDRFALPSVGAALLLEIVTVASVFPHNGNHQYLAIVLLALMALAFPTCRANASPEPGDAGRPSLRCAGSCSRGSPGRA